MRPTPLLAVLTAVLLLACGSGAEDAPAPASVATVDVASPAVKEPYVGRFASDPVLAPADVAQMPADKLQIFRNEVFARHGRVFDTPEMKAHFEAQPWYAADPGYSDTKLTANDRANVALIKSFEEKPKDPVAIGQFEGDALLMFADAGSVVIDPSFGTYEEARSTSHWASRGDWIVTWEGGPSTWTPGAPGVTTPVLWKLDYAKHTATQVATMEPTTL